MIPLAEVFGHNVKNLSTDATRCRKLRLCPHQNRIPNCNKDRAKNPLGVCSIMENGRPVMVCQVRLRQNWKVITDIAEQFFPENATWTTVADVRLYDKFNKIIDAIDFVIVAYDANGTVIDFISLDSLGINVDGNLRQQFNLYIENPKAYINKKSNKSQITPNYSESLYKLLAPQIIYKGSIFHSWKKKSIYALDINLFQNLPQFIEVEKSEAEISWFCYELKLNPEINDYELMLSRVSHTLYQPTLFEITKVEPGPVEEFITQLQQKLDEKLERSYPLNDNSFNDLLK